MGAERQSQGEGSSKGANEARPFPLLQLSRARRIPESLVKPTFSYIWGHPRPSLRAWELFCLGFESFCLLVFWFCL
jgi:hypothetical protein